MQIVIIGYCVVIIVGYGLQGYCGFEIAWFNYKTQLLQDNRYLTGWEYLTRFEFFVGTCEKYISTYVIRCNSRLSLPVVFGLTIPLLGLVISLVGSFCLSCLGLVFPPIMELCVLYPNYGKYKWALIKNVLLMAFGLFAFISGTYCCVLEIAFKLMK